MNIFQAVHWIAWFQGIKSYTNHMVVDIASIKDVFNSISYKIFLFFPYLTSITYIMILSTRQLNHMIAMLEKR